MGFLFSVQTKLANKMLQNTSKIQIPVFVMRGDKNVRALPKSSKMIIEKVSSSDKKVHIFAEADHWLYQSIISRVSSKYDREKKESSVFNDKRVANESLKNSRK